MTDRQEDRHNKLKSKETQHQVASEYDRILNNKRRQ